MDDERNGRVGAQYFATFSCLPRRQSQRRHRRFVVQDPSDENCANDLSGQGTRANQGRSLGVPD